MGHINLQFHVLKTQVVSGGLKPAVTVTLVGVDQRGPQSHLVGFLPVMFELTTAEGRLDASDLLLFT